MLIHVIAKTNDGRYHPINIDNEQNVLNFKEKIASKTGTSPAQLRIVYDGRILTDERQLKDFDLNDKVVHAAQPAAEYFARNDLIPNRRLSPTITVPTSSAVITSYAVSNNNTQTTGSTTLTLPPTATETRNTTPRQLMGFIEIILPSTIRSRIRYPVYAPGEMDHLRSLFQVSDSDDDNGDDDNGNGNGTVNDDSDNYDENGSDNNMGTETGASANADNGNGSN